MKNEHKTLKWCAVVAAFIVSIAAIAGTWFLPAPEHVVLPDEGSAITRVPEEMPMQPDSEDLKKLKTEEGDYEQGKFAADSADSSEIEVGGQSGPAAVPVNVTVKADGMEMHLLTAPVTVKQALECYGIPVGSDDIVEPALDQQLTDGAEITVQRIVYEEVVVSEEVPFKTKVKGTDELPAKTQKVVQEGQKGEDKVTYEVTYADGKEIARKEISRERVKKPVTKIIHKSTVGTINGKEYSRKFTVKAYSYTGGGRTASGLPAAVGRIAVDPRVIPLGTRVYVEGYGFATAADTGGNIKGNTIDVYYNSAGQCRSWGCRNVMIYILK